MLTQEQLEARRTTIGASDAAPILGISPYKTALDLWKEKVEGTSQFLSPSMKRGNDLESEARVLFNQMIGDHFVEANTMVHPERVWQTATPDGINFRGDVSLEIKCNNKKVHEMARDKKIPDYYMAQVQHQMSVLGNDRAFYFSYNGHEGLIVEVKRDNSFLDSLIEKEYEFWRSVMDQIPPGDEKEKMIMTSSEWELLVDEWRAIQFAKEREPYVKEKMLEMTGGKEAEGFGLKLAQVTRKGVVDYSSIPELMAVDLERYRKQPTTFWKIT